MIPQENSNELKKYAEIVWRRKALLLSVAAVVTIIGTAVALLLPAVYRSNAVILIEQQAIPTEFVRSTVTSFADQRIQVISQRVMTSENLRRIVDRFGLYERERQTESMETTLARMRDDIKMEMISADVVDPRSGRPTQATIAFSLAYDNATPQLAQRVANELVSLYLNENLKNRTEAAEETSRFLSEESQRLESEVESLEKALGDFKVANVDQLPEIANLNRELLNRTEIQLSDTERQIRGLQERLVYLTAEVSQIDPYTVLRTARGERVLEPEDRLELLKTELLTQSARYGREHPDVITMRKQVEALETEVRSTDRQASAIAEVRTIEQEYQQLLERYSAEHPDVQRTQRRLAAAKEVLSDISGDPENAGSRSDVPDNPAYIQLSAQVNATRQELASQKEKAEFLREKIENFEQRILKTPTVEQEYRALTRRYETTMQKHREIKNKAMEARLSQNLETERKGEKFTLIEPPLLPENPARPNRIAIVLVSLLLAAAASLASVGTLEALDTRVRGREGIQAIIGKPPLAFIPEIATGSQRGGGVASMNSLMAAGIVGIGMLALAFVHFVVMPLDVFWFVMLRKAGL